MGATALAACGQTTTIERASLAVKADAHEAVALPPPGGPAVISVIERRFSNAIQQDIILSTSATTPGQNMLRVQMFGSIGVDGGDTALSDRQPSYSEISREMRQLLPGVAMQRSDLYAQNSYGPFGYAVGRSGRNDLCLYAWQRIGAGRSDATLASRGSIQVRLRLCQSGAHEEGLLAVMYGYTINAALAGEAWNPYGLVSPADPRLGRTGQPVHPFNLSGPAMIAVAKPVAAPQPRSPAVARPVVQRTPLAPAVAPKPVPANAPVVPPPPSATAPAAPTTSNNAISVQPAAPVVPPPPASD